MRVENLLNKLVELSDCKDLKQLSVQEQFIQACSKDLALYLRERTFTSIDDLVDHADRYISADRKQEWGFSMKMKAESTKDRDAECFFFHGKGHRVAKCRKIPEGSKFCMQCKRIGHMSSECASARTQQKKPFQKGAVASGLNVILKEEEVIKGTLKLANGRNLQVMDWINSIGWWCYS